MNADDPHDAVALIRMVEPREHPGTVRGLFARNAEDATHPRAVLGEGRCELWLAERGGVAIGLLLGTHEVIRDGRLFAGIENLLVDAPFRHQGIGRRLMEAAQAYYERAGLAGVQLATDEANAIAQSLYCSMGYEVTRRYTRVRGGVEEPRVQMVRRCEG